MKIKWRPKPRINYRPIDEPDKWWVKYMDTTTGIISVPTTFTSTGEFTLTIKDYNEEQGMHSTWV